MRGEWRKRWRHFGRRWRGCVERVRRGRRRYEWVGLGRGRGPRNYEEEYVAGDWGCTINFAPSIRLPPPKVINRSAFFVLMSLMMGTRSSQGVCGRMPIQVPARRSPNADSRSVT